MANCPVAERNHERYVDGMLGRWDEYRKVDTEVLEPDGTPYRVNLDALSPGENLASLCDDGVRDMRQHATLLLAFAATCTVSACAHTEQPPPAYAPSQSEGYDPYACVYPCVPQQLTPEQIEAERQQMVKDGTNVFTDPVLIGPDPILEGPR